MSNHEQREEAINRIAKKYGEEQAIPALREIWAEAIAEERRECVKSVDALLKRQGIGGLVRGPVRDTILGSR